MIHILHPGGNRNVRAVLHALDNSKKLGKYFTTLAFSEKDCGFSFLPSSFKRELLRRNYEIPKSRIVTHGKHEWGKLILSKFRLPVPKFLHPYEIGRDLDRFSAQQIELDQDSQLEGVYAYEDTAYYSFQAAKKKGLRCFYELPIAYWESSYPLLQEEAKRLPAWAPTLGMDQQEEKLRLKTEELKQADLIFCPSQFVYDSLPSWAREKKCVTAEFGSPATQPLQMRAQKNRLRLLFAGSLSQRKGLADLFEAMKLLKRSDVALTVMGALLRPLSFYREQYAEFIYEPPRPHQAVLQLMQSCDVLILPSLLEGRALVQQEALSCGLPLIVTRNAGGEDLIDEGKTGFLVPIRSPEKLAEKINWFTEHREELEAMRNPCQEKARQYRWEDYGRKILNAICNH